MNSLRLRGLLLKHNPHAIDRCHTLAAHISNCIEQLQKIIAHHLVISLNQEWESIQILHLFPSGWSSHIWLSSPIASKYPEDVKPCIWKQAILNPYATNSSV